MGMRDFHFKVKVSQCYFIFLIPLLHEGSSKFIRKKIFKGKIIYGLDPFEIMFFMILLNAY